jgi:hypothetical protein
MMKAVNEGVTEAYMRVATLMQEPVMCKRLANAFFAKIVSVRTRCLDEYEPSACIFQDSGIDGL